MWADAQRDGRHAEYRWHTAPGPRSNVANMGERETWTQIEFRTWQNSVTRQQPTPHPQKSIYILPAHESANIVISLVGFRWATSVQ